MPYGQIKVDEITFTNAGVDQTISVSGVVASISGNITATGTISGDVIQGGTLVSGATVTGAAGQFGTITGNTAGFTTVTGTTVTGTTANFVNGTFTTLVSGATVRGTFVSGNTVTGGTGQFTTLTGGTAGFTTVTGTTVTGTTANFVTVSGTTVTGNSGQFTTVTGSSAGFTTITGTTVTGTTASFTSGVFTNISGGTHTITSGVFASGAEATPSISFVGDPNTGIYSPGADQVAISTNGSRRLFIDSSGNVAINSGTGVGLVATQTGFSVIGGTDVNNAAPGIITLGSNNNSVSANDVLGRIRFHSNDASTSMAGTVARIECIATGAFSLTAPTALAFFTNNGIAGAETEKMRIDSTGKVGLGTSAPSYLIDAVSATPSIQLTSTTTTGTTIGNKGNRLLLKSNSFTTGNGGEIVFAINDTNVGRWAAITSSIASNVGGGGSGGIGFATKNNPADTSLTERLTITKTGHVGVGTSGPEAQIDVVDGNTYTGLRVSNTATDATIKAGHITGRHYTNAEESVLGMRIYSSATANDIIIGGGSGLLNAATSISLYTAANNTTTVGTQRMIIDSSGRVGIGTTSPGTYNANLAVYSAGGAFVGALHANASGTFPKASAISLGSDAVSYTYTTGGASVALIGSAHIAALQSASSGAGTDIAFINTSSGSVSEKARIDSSGRLLVGTSTGRPGISASLQSLVQVETSSSAAYQAINNSSDNNGAWLALGKSRGTSAGGVTAVQNNDELGYIAFLGADGTDINSTAAVIAAYVDGTPGSNDMPGRLVFSTTADSASSPTERMRIDSSGRVGIGTTSPGYKLDVYHASNGNGWAFNPGNLTTTNSLYSLKTNGSALATARFEASDYHFIVGNNEAARLDTSGRLLVGTSTARDKFFNSTYAPALQIEGTTYSTSMSSIVANGTGIEPYLILGRSRGTAVGGTTIVNNGDKCGVVSFQGSDGTEMMSMAEIFAQVDGTPGADDMPGRIVLATTADGGTSPTERMRIDSSGRVGIGRSPTSQLDVYKSSGTVNCIADSDSLSNSEQAAFIATGGARTVAIFAYKHSGITNPAGAIRLDAEDANVNYLWTDNSDQLRISTSDSHIGTTSGTVVGTQTSDERLKNILGPVEYGLDTLKQIEPVRYTLKTEPETEKLGFIAQQVLPLIPQSVFDTKDHIEGEPEDAPTKLGMEYVALIPVLVNAIKELSAEVDALKAQLS